jgi:uncharacterized protein (TIGR00251 family)
MPESFKLSVHVQPGARQSAIVGWVDDVLRVRVAVPPVEGKANELLIGLLADALGAPKSRVHIQRGGKGRRKLVGVERLTLDKGYRLLNKPSSSPGNAPGLPKDFRNSRLKNPKNDNDDEHWAEVHGTEPWQ